MLGKGMINNPDFYEGKSLFAYDEKYKTLSAQIINSYGLNDLPNSWKDRDYQSTWMQIKPEWIKL